MHRQNWDDLRFILAVAETGSVSEASRKMGVTHATVLRRIAGFEEQHGEPIFLRGARGYSVLPDKLEVLEAAQEVETAVLAVYRLLSGSAIALKGPVRITSTDSLCQFVLPSIINEIGATFPDLRLSLHSANRHLDFNRLAADVTVRPAAQIEDSLIGQRAGRLVWAAYRQAGSVGDMDWLPLEGPLARSKPGQWIANNIKKSQLGIGSDSFVVQQNLVASGAGQSLLLTLLADKDPRLTRVPDGVADIEVPVWVGSAAEMAHTPKVKAVTAMLVDSLRKVLN